MRPVLTLLLAALSLTACTDTLPPIRADGSARDMAAADGPTRDVATAPDAISPADALVDSQPARDSGPAGDAAGPVDAAPRDAAVSCDQINQTYIAAVALAKRCNPMLSIVQCELPVDDELACPCPTWINRQSTDQTVLDQLRTAWIARSCAATCPDVLCRDPPSATCTRTSGGGPADGVCTDN